MKIFIGIMLILISLLFTIIIVILADSKEEIWDKIEFKKKERNDTDGKSYNNIK